MLAGGSGQVLIFNMYHQIPFDSLYIRRYNDEHRHAYEHGWHRDIPGDFDTPEELECLQLIHGKSVQFNAPLVPGDIFLNIVPGCVFFCQFLCFSIENAEFAPLFARNETNDMTGRTYGTRHRQSSQRRRRGLTQTCPAP